MDYRKKGMFKMNDLKFFAIGIFIRVTAKLDSQFLVDDPAD